MVISVCKHCKEIFKYQKIRKVRAKRKVCDTCKKDRYIRVAETKRNNELKNKRK